MNNNKNNSNGLSEGLMKKILEDEASSAYAIGLLRGESANGGVPDEVVAFSRRKAREFLDRLMTA